MSPATHTLRRWRGMILVFIASLGFVWLVSQQELWEAFLGRLFPEETNVIYPAASLATLTAEHIELVLVSSGLTILVGVPLGIWVTRRSGRDFRDVVAAGVDIGQTFPPVAVLAIMMPILGFGLWPSVVALFLYGLFPVVSNTVAGLEGVPRDVKDAARGMGMGRAGVLTRVELPLAAPVIMAGIRTSVIINIGTATVAAAAGAGGLGDPIFGGIITQNVAYVFEGAVVAALLAVLADAALGQTEHLLTPAGARSPV